ncbi:MAG: LegC family aminotransferase [Flavobacteriales bacterium]
MFENIIAGVKKLSHSNEGIVPLHAPWFDQADEDAVAACVRSTFVSSVGAEINTFEQELAAYTGSPYAVAVVNGTAALHTALLLNDVGPNDLVITQAFTFIATCNSIAYTGAAPVFLDIDPDTLGLSPSKVLHWLESECELREGHCIHRASGKRVKACIPMHSFGSLMYIELLVELCAEWNIAVIEDAAEALGSHKTGRQAGTFASMGTLSFNGNKIMTSGGGGALLLKDEAMAIAAKHLTTQAKVPHPWAFAHDRTGYNYRMPNLNAALARTQLQKLPHNIFVKRELHEGYRELFRNTPWSLLEEPSGTTSNYWLNALLLKDRTERDSFLQACSKVGIQARPVWELATDQPMYLNSIQDDLSVSRYMQDRLVNLPSSARP